MSQKSKMHENGETFSASDGISLKEYLNGRIDDLDTRIELNLKLNQVALDKANVQMNERLERMNEFRDSLKDQAATFLTRDAYEARHKELQLQVDILRESSAVLSGKASANSVTVAYVVSIIGIIIGLVSLLTRI